MSEEITKFFKANIENVKELNLPRELVLSFSDDDYNYYFIKADSYIPSHILEDEGDLEIEYEKVLPKLQGAVLELQRLGFEVLTFEEFKGAEKVIKENKQNSFVANFSEEEKFVYNKIKNFIEEYDITSPAQKQFLISLRKDILKNDEISDLYLEEKAEKMNKNLEDIFDLGIQSLITDFANDTITELADFMQESKKTKKLKM